MLKVKDGNGCFDTFTFEVNKLEALDNSASLEGNNAIDANYQWLNCINNSAILREIKQTFLSLTAGDFAVKIRKETGVDTSNCRNILILNKLRTA